MFIDISISKDTLQWIPAVISPGQEAGQLWDPNITITTEPDVSYYVQRCLAAHYFTYLVQYIHHLPSAHLNLTSLPLSACSLLHLSCVQGFKLIHLRYLNSLHVYLPTCFSLIQTHVLEVCFLFIPPPLMRLYHLLPTLTTGHDFIVCRHSCRSALLQTKSELRADLWCDSYCTPHHCLPVLIHVKHTHILLCHSWLPQFFAWLPVMSFFHKDRVKCRLTFSVLIFFSPPLYL